MHIHRNHSERNYFLHSFPFTFFCFSNSFSFTIVLCCSLILMSLSYSLFPTLKANLETKNRHLYCVKTRVPALCKYIFHFVFEKKITHKLAHKQWHCCHHEQHKLHKNNKQFEPTILFEPNELPVPFKFYLLQLILASRYIPKHFLFFCLSPFRI